MSLAQIMRDDLQDIHSQGLLVDASDLATLAAAKLSPGEPSESRLLHVTEYRLTACDVLNAAGYCACGIKLETPRCPSCSRLHDASG